MKIIHTDNFGGDYPDEKFVEGLPLYAMPAEQIEQIVSWANQAVGRNADRWWTTVPDNYVLKPGFEP